MANLTRIKNNQITDSTILANTKIVPGSIVGSLFNSSLTIASDITITGNLTVQGSSSYLTVASTNTYVNDPLIVLNNAFSGTNTYDIGLLFNRGNQTTTALVWEETAKEFQLTYTSDTGTTYGTINNSGYANLHIGNLTVATATSLNSLAVSGNISAWYGTLSGNLLIGGGALTANTATFDLLNSTVTTLNFGGAVTTANVGAGTGTFTINNPTVVGQQATQNLYNTIATTMNFAGAATSVVAGATTGTFNIRNANVYLPNATTIYSGQSTLAIANVNVTTLTLGGEATALIMGATSGTATISNPTLVGTQTTQAVYNTVATTVNAFGAATTLGIGAASGTATINNALTNIVGVANVQSTLAGTSTTAAALVVSGGLGVAGNIYAGKSIFTGNGLVSTGLFSGTYTDGVIVDYVTGTGRISVGTGDGVTIYNAGLAGTALLAITSAGAGTFTSDLAVNGANLTTPTATFNLLNANSTTLNAFGAATTIAVGANSGTITIGNPTLVGTQTTQSVYNTVATTVNAFQAATTANIGAITGTMQINNPTLVGINTTQAVYNTVATTVNAFGAATTVGIGAASGTATINNATLSLPNATSVTVGQATVTFANTTATTVNAFGAATTLNFAAATGTTTIRNNLSTGGNIAITSGIASTSATTGALTVTGGVGLTGNIYVGLNAVIGGNLSVLGTTTYVNSTTMDVEDNIIELNTGANGAALSGPTLNDVGIRAHYYNAGDKSMFFGRSNDSGNFEIYSDATETSGNITGTYGTVKSGNVVLTGTTNSTTATSGALQVAGGVGIAQDLFVGGGDITTDQTTFNLLNATTTTLNLAGAATTIGVGANSGTITIGNPTLVGTQTTQNVYNTTATTVNAFGAATTLGLGATSGTATISNPTVVGSQATQTLWNTTATTVNAFGAATTANIGAGSGTITINNPTLVGQQATQALYNTIATTMNFAGAATALTIGATTGTLTARNANVWVPNATTIDGAQTTVSLLTQNATTVSAFTSATTANVGAGSGTFTINNPTLVGQQATQNLYNTVATTLNFGGAVTTANVGAGSGTFTINNPTLVGQQATQNLYNTLATTMNFAGAATAITIGAITGTANIRNALTTITGVANILATTDSTVYNTGALIVAGGIGAGGNVHVKSTKQFIVGQDLVGDVYLPNSTAQFFSNIAGYSQVNQQNISSNTWASSDFIATADNGNDSQGYIDLGVNSSTYNQATFTISKANDGYLYVQGNATTGGGNLAIGTATANDLQFFTGGTLAANEVARFNNASGNLQLKQTTVSTSATTGALTVAGGAGFAKNVYVATGATINSTQSSDNFTVKGLHSTALIYADSNTDSVVIGGGHSGASGGNTTIQGGVTLKIDATDTFMVPVGTTAQRPSNSGNVDARGMTRFNSTINNLEFYDGTVWQSAGSVFTVISDRQFSGATGGLYGNVDGTNAVFTIQSSSTASATIVSINGVVQIPVIAYDVSTVTLTFTEAPTLGDVIDVRCLAATTVLSSLASSNGLNQFITDTTGAQIWSGSSSTIQRVNVDPTGVMQLINGTAIGYDETAIALTVSAVTIDTFAVATYRSAKYIVTFTNGTTSYETAEIMVIHDGTTATRAQYGTVSTTGSTQVTYTVTITGGNVLLQAATVSGTGTVKAFATYIKV